MINLTGTDEEVGRQVLADHGGEGDETFNDTFTRPLLYGVGGVTRDPARYATICRLVADGASTHERKATFLLEAANGTRRVGGTWDGNAFSDLMEEANLHIVQVPEGPRQRRLLALHAYHGGIAYRDLGKFELAALAQEESARLEPDPNKAGISLFCALVEWVHYALVVGDPALMAEKLASLRAGVAPLMALDGSDTEVHRWQRANCPAHLLYAHWLAGTTYDGWDADMKAMQNLPEDLAGTFKDWSRVFSAIDFLNRGGSGFPAIELADYVMWNGSHPSTTALAMLVAARAHQANVLFGLAKVLLRAIVNLPGHGAHFVRAVAKRDLAALEAAKS